jgi:hypothetical protein
MGKTRLKVALAICMMVVASAAAYGAVINRIARAFIFVTFDDCSYN